MNLYFDHAATTKVCDEAIEAMEKAASVVYGNPSSLHFRGMNAEDMIEEGRTFFGKILGVPVKDLYFTSGGTESNNLAVQGVARAYQRSGNHIITTSIEHPSVGTTFAQLENEGYRVTRLKVNEAGHINLEELKSSITDETTLVSIMHVNNEIGTVQNLKEIGKLIKETNNETIFHVDGVQGFLKIPVSIKQSKIDLLSISSHKIYGPKGSGLLYIKKGTKIRPLQFGGSQQNAIRPGTENVPGIMGFYKAALKLSKEVEENYKQVLELKIHFVQKLNTELPKWTVTSMLSNGEFSSEVSSPFIVSIRSTSLKGEVVLHALEDYKISVSTGSACSSRKLNISHVLKAIGLEDEESDHSIRISFSAHQNKEDINELIRALVQIDIMFGRFVRK